MGRVGTGKSTIAKRLASELDWPVFSSDETRKIITGLAENQSIGHQHGFS
jgi:predicted kinase